MEVVVRLCPASPASSESCRCRASGTGGVAQCHQDLPTTSTSASDSLSLAGNHSLKSRAKIRHHVRPLSGWPDQIFEQALPLPRHSICGSMNRRISKYNFRRGRDYQVSAYSAIIDSITTTFYLIHLITAGFCRVSCFCDSSE